MKLAVGLALGLAVALTSSTDTLAGGKTKIKPSVTYARSWEAAIAEARLLNIPIVVHNHNFYG